MAGRQYVVGQDHRTVSTVDGCSVCSTERLGVWEMWRTHHEAPALVDGARLSWSLPPATRQEEDRAQGRLGLRLDGARSFSRAPLAPSAAAATMSCSAWPCGPPGRRRRSPRPGVSGASRANCSSRRLWSMLRIPPGPTMRPWRPASSEAPRAPPACRRPSAPCVAQFILGVQLLRETVRGQGDQQGAQGPDGQPGVVHRAQPWSFSCHLPGGDSGSHQRLV